MNWKLAALASYGILMSAHCGAVTQKQQVFLGGASPPLSNSSSIHETFDYVIVGAGNAGMTIGARLSEDPAVRVAILEAGADYHDLSLVNKMLTSTPGTDVVGCGSKTSDSLNDAVDWHFMTEPQVGADGRQVRFARGKTVGGCTARNFMVYQRPSKGSIDSWSRLTGDPSWTFERRFQDYQKSVSFTPPNPALRREFPAAQWDAAAFVNSTGPVHVSYPNTPQDFSKFLQLSLMEQGVKTIRDFNRGALMGVQYSAATIDPQGGHRSTSREFFKAAKGRRNLQIFTECIAEKIIFDDGKIPRALGVDFTHASAIGLRTGRLLASKEVILSAGAFQSPQLLMLSGIGPSDQLLRLDIPIIVENPNVGQGMQDHVFFSITHPIKNNISSLTHLAVDPAYLSAQWYNFTIKQLGPFTNNVADLIAFERFNDTRLASIGASVLSSYPKDWPHVEYVSAAGFLGDVSNLLADNMRVGLSTGKRYASIMGVLVAPRSRGTVNIVSKNPRTLPRIDPGWLTDPVDQKMAVELFKRIRVIFSSKAMEDVLDGPEYFPGISNHTDQQILEWIRKNIMTIWHPACTCSMKKIESAGVLNSKFQVYGTQGLRVVDASSFPDLPPGHPQATVYMIAERAADLIKQAAKG